HEAKTNSRAARRGRSDSPTSRSEPNSPTPNQRRQSPEFHLDSQLGGPVQSRPGKPGTHPGRSGRAHGHRRPSPFPTGNRQDAQPHAGYAAQVGGSTGAETGSGFVACVTEIAISPGQLSTAHHLHYVIA